MPPKVQKVCQARDCSKRFVPLFPRQAYHVEACRERERTYREEEKKLERALSDAHDEPHRQFFPSAFFDGSRLLAVIADIRFELEEDKDARAGNRDVIVARVRALSQALNENDSASTYGAAVSLAAAVAALALRTNGGARFQQRRRQRGA